MKEEDEEVYEHVEWLETGSNDPSMELAFAGEDKLTLDPKGFEPQSREREMEMDDLENAAGCSKSEALIELVPGEEIQVECGALKDDPGAKNDKDEGEIKEVDEKALEREPETEV